MCLCVQVQLYVDFLCCLEYSLLVTVSSECILVKVGDFMLTHVNTARKKN